MGRKMTVIILLEMVWQGGSSEEETVVEDERSPGGGGPVPSWPGTTERVGEADEKYQGPRSRAPLLPDLRQTGGGRQCLHLQRPGGPGGAAATQDGALLQQPGHLQHDRHLQRHRAQLQARHPGEPGDPGGWLQEGSFCGLSSGQAGTLYITMTQWHNDTMTQWHYSL